MYLDQMGLVKETEDRVVLEIKSTISSVGRANYEGTVILTIPKKLLLNVYGRKSLVFCDRDYPFGRLFTRTFAGNIFPNGLKKYHFGMMPGRYYYKDGILHFDVDLEPAKKQSSSIMFYADSALHSYIGSRDTTKTATVFQFGETNLHGLIVSLDDVVGIGKLPQWSGYEDFVKNMEYYSSIFTKSTAS